MTLARQVLAVLAWILLAFPAAGEQESTKLRLFRHRVGFGWGIGLNYGDDLDLDVVQPEVECMPTGNPEWEWCPVSEPHGVTARFGGGMGPMVEYGFSLVPWVELTASARLFMSSLQTEARGLKGGFRVGSLHLSPTLRLPLRHHLSHWAKTGDGVLLVGGGGPSLYTAARLRFPVDDNDNKFIYAPIGMEWHVFGGVEWHESTHLRGGVGLRVGYYRQRYELRGNSAIKGTSVLGTELPDRVREVSGDTLLITPYIMAL